MGGQGLHDRIYSTNWGVNETSAVPMEGLEAARRPGARAATGALMDLIVGEAVPSGFSYEISRIQTFWSRYSLVVQE